ncbi:MAG: EAL domain-containing protein [Proteobacteria bacterium]|nr:EAL domain-containing protein [Pseudomonadota bacterium]NOG59284.1 EAL domain-containing protein [Pseudomonadota bacterium]
MFSKINHKHRFSRQIFLQYFISAIVPVLVLSFLSYLSISELLNKNASRQIYAESRAIGLTLFDRFLNLENNLQFASNYIEKKEELTQYLWLNKMFHNIYIVEKGVVVDLIYGTDPVDFSFSAEQKTHMENRRLIDFSVVDNQFQSYLVQPVSVKDEKYLIAEINDDYLWEMSVKGNDSFCVLINKKYLVFCSENREVFEKNIFDNKGQLRNAEIFDESESQNISLNDREYVVNVWDLFLQPQFGVDSFLIVYFIEKNEAFFDYDYYKSVFPQTILITLLFVYLLSSVQMRRSLVPLSKLTQGVKKISKGKFGEKVNIESHNEFEVLGNAFNEMSNRINKQFIKIDTLSKIDRLILSTSDLEYIVQVLIENIPALINSKKASILIFDADSKYCATNYYFNYQPSPDIHKTNIILSKIEYDEIDNADSVLKRKNDSSEPYLDTVKSDETSSLIICPIKNTELLLGAIIVAVDSDHYDDSYTEDLSELSDRAAVAISNAQWEKKLFQQAHYDALTELPNRYLFKDRLEQAIERAKRNSLNVAVLFIDLDRFKSVNDSLGHAVGDKLLAEVSTVLLKCVRTYDSVARFGGDEYTIILSDIQPDIVEVKTKQLADRILEMMSEPIIIDEREFYVTPSIGISIYPRDATNFDDLLKNADTAMYKAKSLASGNYQFYQTMQNKETLARMELENDLRHAAEKDQLELYFQPKINLHDDNIYAVEALIRWKHPEKGMIPPDIFIPLAEETGLITSIGYWVMQQACSINKKWQAKGVDLNTAVNISADQFRHAGLYDKTMKILRETDVSAKNIEFEITESITIENFGKTIELLNDFKRAGLGLCIDDFGTGYSSMTYLQKIPINKLKIDKSFVDNIAHDKDAASIIGAIIALAHNLKLNVVAEGVETKAQYEYLCELNCDEVQGYYLSRPLPEAEILNFIIKHNKKYVL